MAPEGMSAHCHAQPTTQRRGHGGKRTVGIATPLSRVALSTSIGCTRPYQPCVTSLLRRYICNKIIVEQRVQVMQLFSTHSIVCDSIDRYPLTKIGFKNINAQT